jgi:hypothetical protein
MLQHPARHQETQTKFKFWPWKCHYGGKYGHIKPFCYRLHGYPTHPTHPRVNHVMIKTINEWKPKVVPHETTCSSICLISKEDEVKLWHQNLGHVNLKEISLGYSTNNRAYRVFYSRTKGMMDFINIVVDDSIFEKGIDVNEDVGTSSQ